MPIRNPIEWSLGQVGLGPSDGSTLAVPRPRNLAPPVLRRITLADVGAALRAGLADFSASRTDVFMLCIIYPVVGLVLARLAVGGGVLPLLFPMAAGFALLGPLFGVGLEEMSRLREQGRPVSWADAFAVARAPAFGAILALGMVLLAIFLAWLVAAGLIYRVTLGPAPPASVAQFTHDVLTTRGGWEMIVLGCGVGFVFAAAVLAIGAISFPLLLDRGSSIDVAVGASLRAARENPVAMAGWGLTVAALLVLGSVPLFLGLAIVLPVLGHATWHLYRRLVAA